MKDRMIEEHLGRAIDEMTPDLLGDLMKELDMEKVPSEEVEKTTPDQQTEEKPLFVTRRKHRRQLYKGLAACAAALLIFVGGYSFWGGEKETAAVVGLDVNPSIEMSVDDEDKVITAKAYNDEGQDILSDLNFEGSDINVACNAVVGAMLTRGYLTDLSNSILVSVQAQDAEHGKMLEKSLSKNLNGFLEDSKIAAAILGQYVADDQAVTTFAEENQISTGKAWLIQSLLAQDDRLTAEGLLKLSTQELILLGQEKEISGDDHYGQVNTSEYISREEALLIGAEQAGLTEPGATDASAAEQLMDTHRVTFECDDGIIIYDVDFTAGGMEYEYDINAKTGEVIGMDVESVGGGQGAGSGNGSGSGSGSGGTAPVDRDDDDDDYDDRYDYDDHDDYDYDDHDDDDDDHDYDDDDDDGGDDDDDDD